MVSDTPKQTEPDAKPILVSSGAASSRFIAVIAGCAALYLAKSFLLPITLAVIVALTLGPLVYVARRLHIPSFVTASLLLFICGAGILAGAVTLAAPLAEFISDAPRIGAELKDKLKSIREPVESINSVGEEVERLAGSGDDVTTNKVVVKGPGLMSRAADDIMIVAATVVLTLVLSFFLLISRDMFLRKAIRIFPRLSDKKRIFALITDIEHDVSHYLLTVAIINGGLGICVGISFYLLGVPTPHLWAVLAALLNFLPYIGALTGVMLAFGVSLLTFDSISHALVPPLTYLVFTTIEGQFVTPMVLGRRFSMNTVAILISIAFFGFIWGPIGVLVAVPLLIIFKGICERVESLRHIGEFLSGEQLPPDEADEGAAKKQAVNR